MALSTDQYGYLIDPLVPITDENGATIKDGFLRVYIAGSSTPVITYRNFDGAVNEKTIELDNSGRCKYPVIVNKSLAYKVVVYDAQHSQDTPIITVDKMFAIGASVTAGAGATVVTGLDGLTKKPDGFVDASVIGTDGYVAIDHTLVTDDLDSDAKVTAVEDDRYVPLLNEDVNDPDSKMTLGRLWQWVLGRIKSLPTTITAFRSGDYIAVDGPSGTAKMGKDTLFKLTSGLKENANGTISTHTYNLLTYTGNIGDVVGIAFTTDAPVNLCVKPSGGSVTPILQNVTKGYVEYVMTATSATFGFFLYTETSTTYDINLLTGLNNKSFDHNLKIEGLEEQVGVRETASGTISTHKYDILKYTGKVGDVVGIYFETSANVNLCVKPSGGSTTNILTNRSKGYVEYTMTTTSAKFGFFLYTETSTTYSIALYSKLNKDFASDNIKLGELSEQVGVKNSRSGSISSNNFNLVTYTGKVGDVVVVDFATSKNVNLVANSSSILNNRNKGYVKYTLTTTSVNFGFYLYEATSTNYEIKITTAMNRNIADLEYDTAAINDGLGDSVKTNGSISSDNYNLVTFTGKVGDVVGIYFETDKRVNLVAKPSGGTATPILQNRTSGYIEYTLTTTSTNFGFYRYEAGSTSYKLWVSRYVNGIEPRLNALTQRFRDFGFPARKLNFLSLGDSITTNSYYIPILAGLLGVNVRYNLAVAGATICDRNSTTGYDGNPTQSVGAGNVLGNQLQKLINNPATYTETPDIILISAITNDGAPSETDSDFDEIETHFTSGTTAVEITAPTFDASDTYAPHRKTVAGSLRYVVGTLAKMYPNALIFICTPIQASTSSASKNYPDIMERKQKLIANVGKRLGVDVLHVGENCGICSDFEYEGGFWTSSYATDEHPHQGRDLVDGLHPNSSGSNKMAKYIYTQIMDRIMGYYK